MSVIHKENQLLTRTSVKTTFNNIYEDDEDKQIIDGLYVDKCKELKTSEDIIEWIIYHNNEFHIHNIRSLIISMTIIKENIFSIAIDKYLDNKEIFADRFVLFITNFIKLYYTDFLIIFEDFKKQLDEDMIRIIKGEISRYADSVKVRHMKNLTIKKSRIKPTNSTTYSRINDDIIKLPAKKIAKSLTLIEYSLFEDLKINEIVGKNNKQMDDRYNKISAWIPSIVLTSTDKLGQFKLFLSVCKELEKMNNFNSLSQIYLGLERPCLSRLSLVDQLDTKYKNYYNHLTRLFDACNNYKNYRKAINNARDVAIPMLPVLLKDITFILEANETYVDDKINLNKIILLGNCLQNYFNRFKYRKFTFEFCEEDVENITKFNNIISLPDELLWKISRKILPLSAHREKSPRTQSTEFLFMDIIRKPILQWSSKNVGFWLTYHSHIKNDELLKILLTHKISGYELVNLTNEKLKIMGVKDISVKTSGKNLIKQIQIFNNHYDYTIKKNVIEWEIIDVLFWLKYIHMDIYLENFIKHDIYSSGLLNVNLQTLIIMGIEKLEHRIFLLNEIRKLSKTSDCIKKWDKDDVNDFIMNIKDNISINAECICNKFTGDRLLELNDKELKRMGIVSRTTRKKLLWFINRLKTYGYSEKERLYSKGFRFWTYEDMKEWLILIDKIVYVELFKSENIHINNLLYLDETDLYDLLKDLVENDDLNIFIRNILIMQDYNRYNYNKGL